jgi:hypothetical protein
MAANYGDAVAVGFVVIVFEALPVVPAVPLVTELPGISIQI